MPADKDISAPAFLCMKDYFLTGEEFCLTEDARFGYLKTQPQPEGDMARYYSSDEYISHTDSRNSLFDRLYQLVKTVNISYKYFKISKREKGRRLLDYGCGTGDFLAFAKLRGLDVYGIEPNSNARALAKKKIGLERLKGKQLSDFKHGFDIITLWHVLEHIKNLDEFIPQLLSKLNRGGELLIAVPNYTSYDAKFYGEFWAAYDVPRHLWHFSPQSMKKLFQFHGMEIVKTYPLWFDSFYVSLLSEKYKGNKLGWIRAYFVALFSNIVGIRSGNYSSVIYKIKKRK